MKTIHISTMSGKLQGLRAISTNTLTNEFCVKQNSCGDADNICTKCYSHASLSGYRKNMAPALQRNSDLLPIRLLTDREIPFINERIFRFSAHGELINETHLLNLFKIASLNEGCVFALWTKRKDIVNRVMRDNAKPANLILIFSNSVIGKVLPKPPMHFDRTFNNVPKTTEGQNCTGQKCMDCQLCYTVGGVDTIVEAVK